jgi:hypothetical protein
LSDNHLQGGPAATSKPLEFDWSDSGYEGPGWIAAKGYGFIVSQEEDYDVWVDFTTGGTVVSLRRPLHLSSTQSTEQTSA